jgi:pimeloyl-ACP methyl ester carboxylesterase
VTETKSTAAERDMQVADLVLHVQESGEGEPLVVLHHSTGPLWAPFHDRLADHFGVVAPDMPGYGRSTRPPTARHPSHLATLLGQLLESEWDRVHLVGLGFGGWVAAELAAMGQRRLSSLTLVNAPGIRPREGFIHDPMTDSWTAYARKTFRDDDHFVAVFGEKPSQDVIDVWDYSREMTARVTWKPWMWSLQLPALLQGVRTPTLVVCGGADTVVPLDCGRQYAELLPHARLEVIEDAGHALFLEEPDALARLIADFAFSVAEVQ